MATTSPARIDDDLYASAKLAGEVQSRSASQQVAHWARIGREIEASAGVSQKEIAETLAGSRSYDMLDAEEQAIVRAEWAVRMDRRREALNLAERFAERGRTWVELDDQGNVVERGPVEAGGGRAPTPKKPRGKPTRTRKRSAARAGRSTGAGSAKSSAKASKASTARTRKASGAAAEARSTGARRAAPGGTRKAASGAPKQTAATARARKGAAVRSATSASASTKRGRPAARASKKTGTSSTRRSG